jgi:hypothetical protein
MTPLALSAVEHVTLLPDVPDPAAPWIVYCHLSVPSSA